MIELQSGNDTAMPLRMAEYCLGVYRVLGRFPQQVVLYVGEPALGMQSKPLGPGVLFEYELIDTRTLDGERLLESDAVGDDIIATPAQLRDHRRAVGKIMKWIAGLATAEREAALAQLFILAGLRRLSKTVEQEERNMPITTSILEHEVLGPLFKKGLLEGRQEGELAILRRLIEKRFGALPVWASDKLAVLQASKLEDLSERVLEAQSVEELLR